MTFRYSWYFIGLALLLTGNHKMSAQFAAATPLNERVLVVYNANVPESLEVANYYLAKRGIPSTQKCAITPSDATAVDWYQFDDSVRARSEEHSLNSSHG